jgi:hypothetical protein
MCGHTEVVAHLPRAHQLAEANRKSFDAAADTDQEATP